MGNIPIITTNLVAIIIVPFCVYYYMYLLSVFICIRFINQTEKVKLRDLSCIRDRIDVRLLSLNETELCFCV